MDLSFSEQDRAFQADVRSFLDEAWPQEMRDKQSRSALGKLSKEDFVGECRLDELQFVVEVERHVVVHRIHLAAKNIVRVSSIDER